MKTLLFLVMCLLLSGCANFQFTLFSLCWSGTSLEQESDSEGQSGSYHPATITCVD